MKAAGTYRADRHDKREEVENLYDGIPQIPDFITLDEEEQTLWNYVVGVLPEDVLRRADSLGIALMCKQYSTWLDLHNRYDDARGTGDEFKLINAMATAWKPIADEMGKLGMAPATRAKIASVIAVPKEKDELAEFLGGEE